MAIEPHASPLVRLIGSAAFCDNGTQISCDQIADALHRDRLGGYKDPTPDEVLLLVQGDDDGVPPPALCAAHPALNALLAVAMT